MINSSSDPSNLFIAPEGGRVPTIDESLKRAERLVSDRVGIISRVEFLDIKPDEPPIFWAQSYPSDVVPLCGKKALNFGSAASIDPSRAIMKSVGESVERYCSAQYNKEFLRLERYNGMDHNAVCPEKFALFSEKQYTEPGFPYSPMTSETPIRWVRGFSLVTQEDIYAPAGLAFVPYQFDSPEEPATHNPISTGLACGMNRAAATYKAVLEVIERDAFMITWQNQLIRPRIDLSCIDDPFVKGLLDRLEGLSISCLAWVLTLDIDVPIILIQLSGTSGRPPYSAIGLGVDLDPNRALGLALEEAYLGYLSMNRFAMTGEEFKPEPGYRNVTKPIEHGIAHALWPELQQSMNFLTSSKTSISIKDLPNSYNPSMGANVTTLIKLIQNKGMDVIVVDLTLTDVDNAGFKVVRAIVPGMQPLDTNHNHKHLGGDRLYRVPYETGLTSRILSEEELNPYPHPFP